MTLWQRIKRIFIRNSHKLLKVWWFITRPNVLGVKALLINNEEVVLVRHNYGHGIWTLPGGGCKRGEDRLHAVLREVREELSVQLKEATWCGAYDSNFEYKNAHVDCFFAHVTDRTVAIDDFEIAEAKWWPINALPEDRVPSVSKIISFYESHKL
jgi:ADP-ribose pyrophosphatase YjhB (NUDIX family)